MSVVRVIGVITVGVSYRCPGPHLPRSIFRTGSVAAHAAVWGSFKDITAGVGEGLSRTRVAQNGPLLHTHITTRYRTLKRNINWTASSEFGTYRLCEQRRFRRACASTQSRQNLRCSLIQAVSQEEPSDRKPDPWPLWMTGHAQLKFVMTECSKTQIRLTRLNYHEAQHEIIWKWFLKQLKELLKYVTKGSELSLNLTTFKIIMFLSTGQKSHPI